MNAAASAGAPPADRASASSPGSDGVGRSLTGTTLHVGVNLLWLVPGEVGGTEEYIVRLLDALDTHGRNRVRVTLFVNRAFTRAHAPLAARFTTVVAPVSGSSRPLRVAAEASWLALAARRAGVDLVHHAGGTVPVLRSRPSVVTIHDLQPLLRVESFGPVKRAYLRARLRPSVRAARLVMTVSEHARTSIVERLGADPERVVVVNAPVPALVPPAATPFEATPFEATAPGEAGDGRYVLYPAITYPHKNHLVLVRAFARLAPTHPDLRLVLTGGAGAAEHEVAAEIERLGLAGRVTRTGRVPGTELAQLLAGAAAVAYPSRYEGFGLPVLEAMAAGCPVVAADASALPGVVGDAGLLVDPDDEAGWAAALASVLDDGALRGALVARGRVQAARYTPAAAADGLVNAYVQAAAAGGGAGTR